MEASNSFCLFCGKKLRKKNINGIDDERTAYHAVCFKTLLYDIKNFESVCYTKYNYKKLYDGKTKEEWKKQDYILEF